MNEKILATLEFDKIKGQLVPFLASAAGQREVAALLPASDLTTINHWLQETEDGADIFCSTLHVDPCHFGSRRCL